MEERLIEEKSVTILEENLHYKFLCDVSGCGRAYTRKATLNQHMNTHSGLARFACSRCSLKFQTSSQKQKHTESVHSKAVYSCPTCDKSFANQYNLDVHARVHNDGISSARRPSIECDQCGQTFAQRTDLKKHMRIHSDEKPFSCAECSAAFKFKNSLRRHERTHTKEKNHKCDQCDMTFVQKCDLTRHRDTHEDSGFVCKVCKDVFARKDSLLRHQRLHRPTGKIECPIDGCSEVVASRSALLNHFRTGHSRLEVDAAASMSVTYCPGWDPLQPEHQPDYLEQLGLAHPSPRQSNFLQAPADLDLNVPVSLEELEVETEPQAPDMQTDVPESSTDQQDSQVYSDDGADYVENRFVIDE